MFFFSGIMCTIKPGARVLENQVLVSCSLLGLGSQTSLSDILIRQKSGNLLVFRLHRTGRAVGLMGEAPMAVSKHVALK